MSGLSSLRKDKQEPGFEDSGFPPSSEDAAIETPAAKRPRSRRKLNNENGPVDPVLPEKKRARRRLIGVIALVLAAVIGLPMILDVEPKPLSEDIAVQIPSKDKPAKSNRQSAAAMPTSVEAASSLDAKEEVIESSPTSKATHVGTTVPTPTPGIASQSASNNVLAASSNDDKHKGSAAVGASSKTAANDKPHLSEPAKAGDSKTSTTTFDGEALRAKSILDGKEATKFDTAEKNSGKFVIQVAALATKDKVSELQSKLKEAGISSYTEKVETDTGSKIRVRIGPFASKEQADKVRAKLEKLGLSSSLVSA